MIIAIVPNTQQIGYVYPIPAGFDAHRIDRSVGVTTVFAKLDAYVHGFASLWSDARTLHRETAVGFAVGHGALPTDGVRPWADGDDVYLRLHAMGSLGRSRAAGGVQAVALAGIDHFACGIVFGLTLLQHGVR